MTSDALAPSNPEPVTAAQLLDAFEVLSEGIAVYDANGRLVASNQRYCEMYPLIADLAVPGVHWADLLRAGAERGQYLNALGRVDEWIDQLLDNGIPIDQTMEWELSSGLIYEVQFRSSGQGGFVVASSDITETRRAKAVAREQEDILRTVLEACPVIVVMARMEDGRILYRSPAAITFFGNTSNAIEHYEDPGDRAEYIAILKKNGRVDDFHLSQRDAKGRFHATAMWGRMVEFEGEMYVVTAIVDQSERQERNELIRQVLEACPTPIQMTRADSGEVLFASPETVSLFGRVERAEGYYAETETRTHYLAALRQKGAVNEFRAEYLNASGKRFWGSVSARLIRYNGEEVIVSNTRDLTEQLDIEAELQRQQDQLFQNEKLSAMGELLAGVAHELNNPLSVVVGHSLMLREECEDAETLRQVNKISQAAERCAKIVKSFLTMARQQPAAMQRVDINDLIGTAVDVARYEETKSGVTISCLLGSDLPMASADPEQITQVLVNLLLNAEQAIRESGKGDRITVSSRSISGGDGIEILVEDNGPGIPEAIANRIFEPFFTTKDVSSGTGIGLALSHRIIETHNGNISVSTRPDGGTCFRIALPSTGEAAASAKNGPSVSDEESAARILIVDDEEDVAELNSEILNRSGYEVDVFNDAGLALDSLRQHEYAVIISDLNMPGVDGRRFFESIARDFPHMLRRTGFVTGDTMGRASQTFLGEAERPYIEKPVSPKELRAFVADIIQQSKRTRP